MKVTRSRKRQKGGRGVTANLYQNAAKRQRKQEKDRRKKREQSLTERTRKVQKHNDRRRAES